MIPEALPTSWLFDPAWPNNGGITRPDQSGDGRLRECVRSVRTLTQTILDRPDRGLRAILDPYLAQNHFDMNLYGRFRDVEGARDGLVGITAADTSKNSLLPVCKLRSATAELR